MLKRIFAGTVALIMLVITLSPTLMSSVAHAAGEKRPLTASIKSDPNEAWLDENGRIDVLSDGTNVAIAGDSIRKGHGGSELDFWGTLGDSLDYARAITTLQGVLADRASRLGPHYKYAEDKNTIVGKGYEWNYYLGGKNPNSNVVPYAKYITGLEASFPNDIKARTTKPINFVDELTVFTDLVTVKFFEKYLSERDALFKDYKSMLEISNAAKGLYDEKADGRWYSPYLSAGLAKVSKEKGITNPVTSVEQMKEYIKNDFKSAENVIASNIGNDLINTTYVKPIITDSYLTTASKYDAYKAALYAASSPQGNKDVIKSISDKVTAFIDPVGTPLGFLTPTDDNAKLVDLVLTKLSQETSLTINEKKQLYSIVQQRGSMYSSSSTNPVLTVKGGLGDVASLNNADKQARNVEDQVLGLLDVRANNGTDPGTQQMYTINLRLQYHYWAMQTAELGTSTSDSLSETPNAKTYFRGIEPVSAGDKFKITNMREYTNFMNAANEIQLMRTLFMDQLAGDVLAAAPLPADLIDQVIYLKQLKNGIEFLQSINSSDFNVQKIIDYWYEAIPIGDKTKSMSLEELYNKTQALGLDPNLDPYKNADPARPLAKFFDTKTGDLNEFIKMGISQSATFLPMKTNVYNVSTYRAITNEDFYKFQYQWGYYRKALMIDTNLQSAVDQATTGKKGKLKVATLKDMLQPEKDISLYVDDNFYNVKKLAEMQDKTLDRLNNQGVSSNTNFWGRIWDWATQVFSIDILEITKTSEIDKYSKNLEYGILGKPVTQYADATCPSDTSKKCSYGDDASSDVNTSRNYAVFSKEAIDKYVAPIVDDPNNANQYKGEADYSVMQPFAFVSAVYRDSILFEYLNRNTQRPVFISSKDLYSARQASEENKSSLMNYALLKNLESNMVIGYSSTMDMDSPIYMDIFGNILTESGYVVVPAAANATMQKKYDPYTAAFLTTYGKPYKLPTTYKAVGTDVAGDPGYLSILEENKTTETWDFQNKAFGFNTKVDITRLSTSSASAMDTLYKIYNIQFKEAFQSELYISNVFMEVVRGAPIENINKDFEGLNPGGTTSRAGIVHAVKLDNLKEALKMNSQNAILAIPNLAFVDGIEYVVLFTYKAVIIICIIMILVQIFVSAMQQKVGLKTILGIILTLALTLASIFTVPLVFGLTYYQSNKALLQGETEYIAMLNYEKQESGVEIGMTTVGSPNTETTLLMKAQDVKIPWYDLFYKIIYAPITSNMKKIYEEAASDNLAMKAENFQLKSGSLYYDMKDLFDSSLVMFDANFNSSYATLYQRTKGQLPASFYTPYYVFLDSMISDVNTFNAQNDTYSYTTGTYTGTRLKSLGLIKDYFESDQFIKDTSQDMLHLREIYGMDLNSNGDTIFEPSVLDQMRQSQWLDIKHEPKDIQPRVDKLNKEARKFVMENKDLIGKISDDTFLKVMSLHLAMMHNKMFGVDSFQSIEIFNLSVDDLTRLSVADRPTVMKGSPLSYTRFIYNESGDIGIYLSAVLNIIVYASGWIKPAVTLIMFLVLFVSFFIYRIVLRRKSENLTGYFRIFGLICGCNLIYAGLIKVSMLLPSFLAPAVCLLVQIILQLAFLALYGWIATISVKNWRDLAADHLNINAGSIKDFFLNRLDRQKEKGLRDADLDPNSGWRKYKRMKDNDKARKYTIRRGRNDI
jgi:hypothetical protein